jgi:fluoroquinolone transport system permease protein
MKTTTIFKTLAPVDLKNVQRDSLLLWIPLLPLILALLLRVAVPELAAFLYAEVAFDLVPYYPLLMSSFVLLVPSLVGMIIGFLLLDERDEQILTALLVTPMPLDGYLLYRISLPMILGTLMTLISYPLAGLTPLPFLDLLIISLLGSITAPLLALFLAAFAQNKVAGFAMAKMGNGILMIPTVSYFIDSNWQLLAGIVPAYWPAKAFWLAAAGESYWLYAVVGLVVNLLALWMLLRRFKRVVYR